MNQKKPLPKCWMQHLAQEFDKPYMSSLSDFLQKRKVQGASIYPNNQNIFRAFHETKFADVKVVLLGQDPYHGPNQAHGLSFSVPSGEKVPPSLRNIYKEIRRDLVVGGDEASFESGELFRWSQQGVLLLNSVLTVEHGEAGSHRGQGWEKFTDAVIRCLVEQRRGLVFLLWGAYAQKKASFVDESEHCVLKAPHPSPLSAHRGFLGCSHFSKANLYMKKNGNTEINWV
jgi:uracil-DNA glycosylase